MTVSSLRSRSIHHAIAFSVVGRVPNGIVPLAVVLLVLLAHLPIGGSAAALVTLAALTGISRPPLAPLGRAFFGRHAIDEDELAAALALDAAATEAIYILGPLL